MLTFIETPVFTEQITSLLDDDEYSEFQAMLIRESVGLSQDRCAALIHVAPSTLRNWEQGRRKPGGAAAALLTAIRNDPANVLAALNAELREE